MLILHINPFSVFDERTDSFINIDEHIELRLENSLHAIAEWEKKYKKQWLPENNKNPYAQQKQEKRTPEEMLYFIKCMILNHDLYSFDDKILYGLTQEDYEKIRDYMQDSQSALTSIPEVKEDKKNKAQVKMTSERVYAWIAEQQIPWEAEYWNINRLFVILRIAAIKSQPPKKMDRRTAAKSNAALNRARLKGRHH